MEERLKLGVRELVEFCCRGGDLGGSSAPAVKAIEGLQTHQRIQQRHRDRAAAEVAVSSTWLVDGIEIELGGRIDLLFAAESPPRIEEIKTVYADSGEADDGVHWAQLYCYGACYARLEDIAELHLSLNRVNLFSRRERRVRRMLVRAELERFVAEILGRYLRWYRLVSGRRDETRRRAHELAFPHTEFRRQQRHFAAEVYRAIAAGQRLMVEAPTGSGKTIGTLFPALKALGEDLCDQIVYLSAKVSGQQQAVDAIERMDAGASYLVIRARARSCPCNRDDTEIEADGRCRRCIGFFDRLPDAREQLFADGRLDAERVRRCADQFDLCPFELALQMLPWVDIAICDFNYVFDPLVQLGHFRAADRRKLLLIDELHNLVDRARGMYSASLSRRQLRAALEAGNSREIETALGAILRALDRELRSQAEDEAVAVDAPEALLRACRRFGEKLGFDLFANKRIASETLDLAREIFRFQCIGQLFDRHHRSLGHKPVRARALKLLCLNAHEYLRDCYPLFDSVCGFSATLSPPDYFRRALGLGEDCRNLSLDPAFPAERLGVFIGSHIDTRYREREQSIDRICASIAATCQARPGNYLVFFPAYTFMQQVHERFCTRYPHFETRLQQRDFDDAAQREFLDAFFDASGQLGFAIMGGRFAEGIDYRGEALIGAIIVGVGLPQANLEQKLIQQDFDAEGLNGFDYAFRFPGLLRVVQSAGRVIRDERDRGVVVLLERRFREPGYARLLPRHWRRQYCHSAESLEQSLQAFWHCGGEDDGTD